MTPVAGRPRSVGDKVVYRLHVLSYKAQNVSAKLALRWSKTVLIAEIET